MLDLSTLVGLTTALGVGLLIGLERGWKDRADPEGSRIAGFRTIGLIGLFGGLAALVDQGQGLVVAGGLVAIALLLRQGYKDQLESSDEVSVTTLMAALLAYGLGAVAVLVSPQIAAMGGVVTTFLLWIRVPLHAFLDRLSEDEISAFLRWLLISIVVLPLLPDEDFGPFEALNARTIWLMVVLISGLSFLAYVGTKWFGQKSGLLLTAFLGGLVSSTAVTLAIARMVREHRVEQGVGLSAICLAWTMMLIRTGFVITIIAPTVLITLVPTLGAMLVVLVIGFLASLNRASDTAEQGDVALKNPLDLSEAATFAIVLTLALMLSKGAAIVFGDQALLLVSSLTGAIDIEAVSLTVPNLLGSVVSSRTVTIAITLAVFSNTLFKAVLFLIVSKGRHPSSIIALTAATIVAGGIGLLFSPI
ncbi:MAG: MgtC/SapB family protein [Henriciella sp.]